MFRRLSTVCAFALVVTACTSSTSDVPATTDTGEHSSSEDVCSDASVVVDGELGLLKTTQGFYLSDVGDGGAFATLGAERLLQLQSDLRLGDIASSTPDEDLASIASALDDLLPDYAARLLDTVGASESGDADAVRQAAEDFSEYDIGHFQPSVVIPLAAWLEENCPEVWSDRRDRIFEFAGEQPRLTELTEEDLQVLHELLVGAWPASLMGETRWPTIPNEDFTIEDVASLPEQVCETMTAQGLAQAAINLAATFEEWVESPTPLEAASFAVTMMRLSTGLCPAHMEAVLAYISE